jgi:hypothetical protein
MDYDDMDLSGPEKDPNKKPDFDNWFIDNAHNIIYDYSKTNWVYFNKEDGYSLNSNKDIIFCVKFFPADFFPKENTEFDIEIAMIDFSKKDIIIYYKKLHENAKSRSNYFLGDINTALSNYIREILKCSLYCFAQENNKPLCSFLRHPVLIKGFSKNIVEELIGKLSKFDSKLDDGKAFIKKIVYELQSWDHFDEENNVIITKSIKSKNMGILGKL